VRDRDDTKRIVAALDAARTADAGAQDEGLAEIGKKNAAFFARSDAGAA
jgi:hypothetical protein